MASAALADAEPNLVGRTTEWNELRRFLNSASDGAALLLTGEPGAGKTALLDAVAAHAATNGTSVMRSAGSEFEASIGFASLHQLLHPFVGQLTEIDPSYTSALSGALGLSDRPPANRLVLSSASVALLRHGYRGPALVVVDDVHWVDAASAEVLTMMSRRLAGTGIGLLFAQRSDVDTVFRHERLPELHVGALDPDAALQLLGRRHPTLDAGLQRRVLEAANGNPLALVELPDAFARRELRHEHGDPLPLTDRLQRAFAVQVADLPLECRRLLLLAVLDGTGDVALLGRAADDRELADLEPAQRRGLISITTDGRMVRLRHPLTGAAVVELASSDERRRAHRRIAELSDDPDRRAWHLGVSTDGPDDTVADTMERAAERWLRRGDTVGAITAWVRAGRLSSTPAARARRLALAATHAAQRTTDFRESRDLLTEAVTADPSLRGSLTDACAAAFLLVNVDGNIDAAHRALMAATVGTTAAAIKSGEVQYYLLALAVVSWLGERPEWWDTYHDTVAAIDNAPFWTRGVDCLTADPAHRGGAVVAELDTHLADINAHHNPDTILNAAACSMWVDRLGACHSRAPGARRARRQRRGDDRARRAHVPVRR